jgi:hypothetical protein
MIISDDLKQIEATDYLSLCAPLNWIHLDWKHLPNDTTNRYTLWLTDFIKAKQALDTSEKLVSLTKI